MLKPGEPYYPPEKRARTLWLPSRQALAALSRAVRMTMMSAIKLTKKKGQDRKVNSFCRSSCRRKDLLGLLAMLDEQISKLDRAVRATRPVRRVFGGEKF